MDFASSPAHSSASPAGLARPGTWKPLTGEPGSLLPIPGSSSGLLAPLISRERGAPASSGSFAQQREASEGWIAPSLGAITVTGTQLLDGQVFYRGSGKLPPAHAIRGWFYASRGGERPAAVRTLSQDELLQHTDYLDSTYQTHGRNDQSKVVSLTSSEAVAQVFALGNGKRDSGYVYVILARKDDVVASPGIYAEEEQEFLTHEVRPHQILAIMRVGAPSD